MEENRETGLFLEQLCMNEPETLRLSMCTKHIYKVEFQEEFYLLFDRKSEFGQNSEILGLHVCANMKLHTQSATDL